MSAYFIHPRIEVTELDKDAVNQFELGAELLILVSATVRRAHNLDNIFNEWKKHRELDIYDHIKPDAPFTDLDFILQKRSKRPPDTIVAIGGGSVIDAAKALSVAFGSEDYKDLFYGKADMPSQKVKVLAIPTTAGTGAELSFGAILYDIENKFKGGLRGPVIQPDYVLIDARLYNTAPFKLKAEVGFDCLTHAVETYVSKKSNPLVKMQSVNCLRNIFNHLLKACEGSSLFDMERIAISSALMGVNLAYSSTCLPHRIQYVIGPLTGTSHAQGLIALYKGWIPFLAESQIEAFDQLARDLGTSAQGLQDKIAALKEQLSISYSLRDLGIDKEQLSGIAHSVTGNLSADPSYRGIESIEEILKRAL